MELLPVKSVVLLPIFFVFVVTLAGCGSSETATTIVIRDLLSASETLWDDVDACWDEPTEVAANACAKAVFETLPPITGNTASLEVDEDEGDYWMGGFFYAGFSTGPAPSNSFTWTLTVNGQTGVGIAFDGEGYYLTNQVYVILNIHPNTTDTIALTASVADANIPDRVITLVPQGNRLIPAGSQRQ